MATKRCSECGQVVPPDPSDEICVQCGATFGNFIHYPASRCGNFYGCTVVPGHTPTDHHAPVAANEPEEAGP